MWRCARIESLQLGELTAFWKDRRNTNGGDLVRVVNICWKYLLSRSWDEMVHCICICGSGCAESVCYEVVVEENCNYTWFACSLGSFAMCLL